MERVDGTSQFCPGCPLNGEASKSFKDTLRMVIFLLPSSTVGHSEYGLGFWAHVPGSVPSQLCNPGESHSIIKWGKSILVPSVSELAKGPKEMTGTGNGNVLAKCNDNYGVSAAPVGLGRKQLGGPESLH